MHSTGTMTTAKTATVGLYVSLAGLLTAALSLLGAVVRMVVALVAWVAARVEARTPARARRDAPPARDTTSRPAPGLRLVTAEPGSSMPPAGPMPPTGAQRLTSALVGLGFSSKEVTAIVASLGARVEREPLQVLIPVALRALAPAALAGSPYART